ncbi:MAG: hypothetical protein JWN58_212 [Gammaproteobacteria bacterium]|nr:hypothetical protein [Gammaproteobacteria bacterium]
MGRVLILLLVWCFASGSVIAQDARPECARKWLAHKAATNATQDQFPSFFKKCISGATSAATLQTSKDKNAQAVGPASVATSPRTAPRGKSALQSGVYIASDTPCDEGSMATRLTVRGRQVTGGRGWCVDISPATGSTVKATPCQNSNSEDANSTASKEAVFTIKSSKEFATGSGREYRWCEGIVPEATSAGSRPQVQASTPNAQPETIMQRLAAMGVQQVVDVSELAANPFIFKGKIIATRVRFRLMTGENEALFRIDDYMESNKLFVSKVPSTRFRQNQPVFIVVRVVGLNSEFKLPHGEYVGSLYCTNLECVQALPEP